MKHIRLIDMIGIALVLLAIAMPAMNFVARGPVAVISDYTIHEIPAPAPNETTPAPSERRGI